ncbi:uncharacterized protein LOC106666599 [Cimex lectularius]|uniref:CPR type cuticle protein n=1 Tax=Cimex lectularius TaxID=79782 RepID=A0A8I6RQM9_CIMLE|nr:uncharacterized protein LOC106666599 [Cimex lectularius]
MLIQKNLLFHIMISICVAREIDWNYDLMTEEANNQRIAHTAVEEKPAFRGKKQILNQERSTTAAPDDDEDKKTLAQQVADGKYGLIQTELFSRPVKRPGILSYEINPEVPKDNVNNLGGLQPEEIWLAENHLLVLKGGGFSSQEQNGKSIWPPIDNYIAPQRQVKIPPNPKVPPPFPVQLKDGGPIEFIRGVNGSGGPPPFFDPRFGPPPFLLPGGQPDGNLKEILKPLGNSTEGNGRRPFPLPGPGIGLFPPAVAFLPPPGNFTELDEDDPSIYYPPPYDFFYPKDNSSHVPPGPLVPGIILPPPPNFFAPYDKNKPHTHKPSHSQRKPSKSRPTQYLHEHIHNKPRTTKPPKPTVVYKVSTLPTSTTTAPPESTSAPITITVTDNTPNEIQRPRTLPPNTPVGDWVPIPAPRPFYISDLNSLKPTISSNDAYKIKYDLPKNGWVYSNITEFNGKPKITDPLIRGWDQQFNYQSEKRGRHFTSTEAPLYTGFKPIFVTQNRVKTTTQPEVNFVPNYNIKTPKEYYFYEEPQIADGKFVNHQRTPYGSSTPDYYDYQNKDNYETNTLSPPPLLGHVSVKNPSENGRVRPLNMNYFEEHFVKPTILSTQPSDDYYYKNDKKENKGYLYNAPTGPPVNIFRNEYVANLGQRKNLTGTKTTTEKPPVYEYSYSAPGYGSIEAPKVGINYGTTPKPLVFETNFTPLKKHQFSFFEYQSSPKANIFEKEYTTARPQYYSHTHRPPSYNDEAYNSALYKTPSPYSNVFHQDMGLLDDITKKYFTLFGQKLNNEGLSEPLTTPLTPVQNVPKKQYYNVYSSAQSTTEVAKQNIKFPDDVYEIQNDQQYYSKPQAVSLPNYRQGLNKHNPRPNHGFSNYYRLSSPQYQSYEDADRELVRPGHPLHSDISVNFKNPHPTVNPDAEYINPYYLQQTRPRGNAFISYQLPGSGGHFYFLTPQTVKPDGYHLLNQGFKYPDAENGGYFKRNTQTKPPRPRRTRLENNSPKPIK